MHLFRFRFEHRFIPLRSYSRNGDTHELSAHVDYLPLTSTPSKCARVPECDAVMPDFPINIRMFSEQELPLGSVRIRSWDSIISSIFLTY